MEVNNAERIVPFAMVESILGRIDSTGLFRHTPSAWRGSTEILQNSSAILRALWYLIG